MTQIYTPETINADRTLTFAFKAWRDNGAESREFHLTMPYCSGSRLIVQRALRRVWGNDWTLISDVSLITEGFSFRD